MKRDKSYYRYQRNRAINKKCNILKRLWGLQEFEEIYTDNRKGKLSKGKIHCSCWICRKKSYIELRHSEKKKLIAYKQEIDDY